MNKTADILIIDDEEVVIDAVKKICSIENYSVDDAKNATIAIKKITDNYYPIIITDIMLPDGNGFDILEKVKNDKIESVIILTTGYSTIETAVNSLIKGGIDFIPKPFTADELLSAIFRANKILEIINKQKKKLNLDSEDDIYFVQCPDKYLRLGYFSWMFQEKDDSVLIGITDLFLKIIETIKSIDLFKNEQEITQALNCANIVGQNERTHVVLSPLSGRIIEVNQEIINNPSLLEKDPFFKGWLYKIIPNNYEYEKKYLIPYGSEIF